MIDYRLPDPQEPNRVVVVGARGFVGSDLTARLQVDGIDVLPISSSDIDLCSLDSIDLLKEQIESDDIVVLVSALTPDRGKDIHTLMNNLAMGEHFCGALSQQACAHVVYISSDAVYEDDANPVREDSCCHPSSYHGLMHLTREVMLRETCAASGIPLFILRPSLLYGARDTHNSYGPNRFMRLAASGEGIKVFGNGEEKRDHVYIGDLSELAHAGIVRRSEGVLNAATGDSRSFHDVASLSIARLESQSQIEPQPRATPITHRHFDVTEVHKAFPNFSFTSLEVGLEQMEGELDE
jgi:nucleoside-diphosphate-sugar epimerase